MAFPDMDPLADFGITSADAEPATRRLSADASPSRRGRVQSSSSSSSSSGSSNIRRLCQQFGSSSDDDTHDPGAGPPSEVPSASVQHFLDPAMARAAGQAGGGKKDSAAAAAPVSIKYLSSEEVTRRNIVRMYGEAALENAQIDLEHTSCEELEREDQQRQIRRDGLKRNRQTAGERTAQRNRRLLRRIQKSGNGAVHSASLEHLDTEFIRQRCGLYDTDNDLDDDDYDNSDSSMRRRVDYFDQPLQRSDDTDSSPPKSRLRIMAPGVVARLPSAATAIGKITQCFLCGWGREEYTLVDNQHIKELFRILYSKPGTDWKIIALEAHKFYMSQIYRDAVLRRQRLPVWRSQAIYICLTQHKKEPKIKLQMHLTMLDQKIQTLDSMCFFEHLDGTIHPHHKNLQAHRDTMRDYWKLMEKDMTRMNFYQPELNIKLAESEYRAHSVRVMQHRAVVNKLTY